MGDKSSDLVQGTLDMLVLKSLPGFPFVKPRSILVRIPI
jgi:hypothetical protein